LTEAVLSTTERAIENQRIGGLQIRVAALCTFVQICDAYDVNAIGVSVPSLTHAWNLTGPAFTVAFLWSSIGIMVGALSSGPIGDRIGRRPLLIGSMTIFGLASLLTAFAGSLLTLSVLRFFTGLGIGGGFPGAATLTGDYAPHRLRATMDLHRRAVRRLYMRAARRISAAEVRLAEHIPSGRCRAAADGAGAGIMAAGIAAVSRGQT